MRVTIGNLWVWLLASSVFIVDGQTIPIGARKTSEKPYFSCELFIQKKEHDFFVGEIIPFVVHCTFDPQGYALHMIVPPNNSEIIMGALPEATIEQRICNDVSCTLYEWKSNAYAKTSGEFEFGPFQMNGEQKTTRSAHGFFRIMMNSSFKAYSNTVALTIHPLPQSSFIKDYKGIFPVGDFHSVHVECERFSMKTGEAQTIRYILEGSGNGALLDHPALDVPAGLKYYPAEKKQESPTCFVFEYILQALEPGIITIPVQNFFYFDPHGDVSDHNRYRILKTASMRLHITPGVTIPQDKEEMSEEENKEQETQEILQNEQNELLQQSFVQIIEIPKKIFIGMILILLIMILSLLNFERLQSLKHYLQERRRYRVLLRHAREGSKIFEKTGNSALLYESFKKLSDIHVPHSEEWDEFFSYLKSEYFGQKNFACDKEIEIKKYLKKIDSWIHYFEKKLWQKK